MKNITLRSDGRYMGRKQINGNIITVYAHTSKQCLEKLKKAIRDYNKNPTSKDNNQYTLYEWMNQWHKTYKEPFVQFRSNKIIINALSEIKNGLKDIRLKDITSNIIQSFLNKYPLSRKKEFIALYFNALLQKAEDLNIIEKNPFKAVVKDKKINNVRKPFNLEEQKIILSQIKGTDIEPVILFYLCTGIRKNELNTINIENDIDTKRHFIKIKNEKKRSLNDTFREIDITPELENLILKNLKSFRLTTNQIYRKFKQLLEGTGVEGSLHNLRHTFATNQYYLGTPAKQVQVWLGHETVELTQNIYTHIDRTITKEDILKLYNNLYFKF